MAKYQKPPPLILALDSFKPQSNYFLFVSNIHFLFHWRAGLALPFGCFLSIICLKANFIFVRSRYNKAQ